MAGDAPAWQRRNRHSICRPEDGLHLSRAQRQYPNDRQAKPNRMNADLVKKALEIVLNSNVLINLVSRRVRQLNGRGGGGSRALLADNGNPSAADIALTELIEGKMSFEMPEIGPLAGPNGKDRGTGQAPSYTLNDL
jgi:hypothetical protein